MELEKYNSKRNFSITKEPKGIVKKSIGDLKFVIQKHAASRLHYDLRLEIDGVLVSWAVPKGPSANSKIKRLAMQTENHPMDYMDFEGTIPKGQYGGGTMMVWDVGTYSAEGNDDSVQNNALMRKQLHDGQIKIILSGQKLTGTWHLIKMKGDDNAWLLMKHEDEHASSTATYNELSILSKRDLSQIDKDSSVWNGELDGSANLTSIENNSNSVFTKEVVQEAKRMDKFPDWKPMLATSASESFDDDNWLFETKYDGYRAFAEIKNGKTRLLSRNGNIFSNYKSIEESFTTENDVIYDGEIVVENTEGNSNFQWLQHFEENPEKGVLKFYVFDILYFNGFDLRQIPLLTRKNILRAVVPQANNIIYSEHQVGFGIKAFKKLEQLGGEGIIAKKGNSIYGEGKRSKDWLKIKIEKQQEMVIGGFTNPKGSRNGLGALLCGYYTDEKLHYSGKVGTGFTDKTLKILRSKLDKIERKTSPFAITPDEPNVHWVTPKLVAQIKFSEFTETNKMRHSVYLGLRSDKKAKDVILEEAKNSATEVFKSYRTMKSAIKKLSQDKAKKLSTKIEFTNIEKVFWPKLNITKGDVISYYSKVSDFILPYLKDRPQSLRRTPNGLKDDGFFQKNVAGLAPKWAKTRKIKSASTDESIEYLLCQDKDTLLYMANLGCIELHPWSSRIGSLNNPDFIIFDLDSKDAPIESIVLTAQKLKEILDKLKVPSFIKTSGGNGLHVFIPILNKYSYADTRNFSHLISQMVHRELPEITSLERMPSKRKGKVYLDYLQNGKGKTMASIYSLRPREGAGVSTPLDWDEINDTLNLKDYNFFTILARLEEKGDLWKNIFDSAIDLKHVLANIK